MIAEGPYEGQVWGLFYADTLDVVADTGSATLILPEDLDGGSTVVTYRVKAGAERRDYILPQTIEVPTNCAPDDPVTANDCKKGGWVAYGFSNQGRPVHPVREHRPGQPHVASPGLHAANRVCKTPDICVALRHGGWNAVHPMRP